MKRRLRGLPELGAAIDERIGAKSARLAMPRSAGGAQQSVQSRGGGIGGGPGGDPAYPETLVESITDGMGGEPRDGRLRLLPDGTLSLSCSPGAGPPDWEFNLRAASLLSVETLPAEGDSEIVYRRTDDATLWWDASGSGTWLQLAVDPLWQRASARLTPVHSGDEVLLEGGSCYAKRAGGGGSETMLAGYAAADEPGTDYPRFRAYHDGVLAWGAGGGAAEDCALARAAGGILSLDTATALRSQTCFELKEQGSAPPAAASGHGRLYALNDARLYFAAGGGVQDLGRHAQSCPCASGSGGNILCEAQGAAHPSATVGSSPDLAISSGAAASFPGSPGASAGAQLTGSYVKFSWTPMFLSGAMRYGCAVAALCCARRLGNSARISARVYVNDKSRLSYLTLGLSDVDGSNAAGASDFADLRSSLSDGAWVWLTRTVDISGFSDALRLSLTAWNSGSSSVSGLSIDLRVEQFVLEQWAV